MQNGSAISGKWTMAGFFVVSLGILALSAQETTSAGQVRSLNGQLLQLYAQLREDPTPGAGTQREQAGRILQQRIAVLEALIEQDPAEALRMALPSDVLSELSVAFPGGRAQLESRGVWEGPIEYIVEDSPDFRSHRNIRAMAAGGETLFIQFAGREPAGLKNGDVLRVQGVRAGNQVAASDGAIQRVMANARPPRPPSPPPCSAGMAPLPGANSDVQRFLHCPAYRSSRNNPGAQDSARHG